MSYDSVTNQIKLNDITSDQSGHYNVFIRLSDGSDSTTYTMPIYIDLYEPIVFIPPEEDIIVEAVVAEDLGGLHCTARITEVSVLGELKIKFSTDMKTDFTIDGLK